MSFRGQTLATNVKEINPPPRRARADVGSGNYLKPDVRLPQIPQALTYLGCWFLMVRTVYCFLGIETKCKSIK
jgi:hypothetical protein